MSSLNKVIWAEGVFLGQQHFQQWDNYIEERQRLRETSLAPLAWGILELSIDENALLNGQCRLQKCTAIYPHGQIIHYSATDAKLLTCELKGNPGETIDIYLCLPVNQNVSGISGYQQSSMQTTWQAEYRQVTDVYDTKREREVMFGYPNLLLLRHDEAREHCHSLKIAEIVGDGEGRYRLNNTFIPPLVQIRAAPHLQELMRRVIEVISAKVRIIKERRQQFRGDITEFGQSDLAHFLLLQALNGKLPLLQHLYQHGSSHPQDLYLLFAELSGILSSFSNEDNHQQIPAYSHEQLSTVFSTLENLIKTQLDVVMPTRMAALKLHKETDTMYSVDSIDSVVFQKSTFFIAVSFESDDTQWIDQFARQAKVGARQDIKSIITSALPGVRLIHTQRPPNKLPIKTGYEYFHLEPSGSFWEKIKTERSLALFLPFSYTNAHIELTTVEE